MSSLRVDEATVDDAEEVRNALREALAGCRQLDPPGWGLTETTASVAASIGTDGGLICRVDGATAGALLFDGDGSALGLGQVSVVPPFAVQAVLSAIAEMAEEVAARRGYDDVRLLTRPDSSSAIQFWTNRGYGRLKHDGPDIELGKALPLQLQVRGADNTRALGRQLASVALPGDLVILSGELGAGKTTFTQGLGTGLEIRGEITSPTFVISRIHPSLVGGPSLVHVDAYRLSDHTELDGLDLDALVEDAVTVVEWGEGLAEALADHRLEVHLGRGRGADADDGRTVTVTPVGGRWYGRGLRSALLGTRRQGARRERH